MHQTPGDPAERTLEPSDRRSASERMLEAAEYCFRRRGYRATTLRDIAEQAGVSKSLIVYHFGSKARLYVLVQARLNDRLAASVRAAARQHGGTSVERGLLGWDALVGALNDRGDLSILTTLVTSDLSSGELVQELGPMRAEARRLLGETMTALLGPDPNLPMEVDVAADVILAALSGVRVLAALGDPPQRLARTLQGLRSLVRLALEQAARENGAFGGGS